jgi:hypothetical protein
LAHDEEKGASIMNDIVTALQTVTALFGAFVALAVLVAGFFLGRRWLGKAMAEGGSGMDTRAERLDVYRGLRSSGWTPAEIQRGQKTM